MREEAPLREETLRKDEQNQGGRVEWGRERREFQIGIPEAEWNPRAPL